MTVPPPPPLQTAAMAAKRARTGSSGSARGVNARGTARVNARYAAQTFWRCHLRDQPGMILCLECARGGCAKCATAPHPSRRACTCAITEACAPAMSVHSCGDAQVAHWKAYHRVVCAALREALSHDGEDGAGKRQRCMTATAASALEDGGRHRVAVCTEVRWLLGAYKQACSRCTGGTM
jgi:hypothetical protein